jgi:hypothetical protein
MYWELFTKEVFGFLKLETIVACFQRVWKIRCDKLGLNINLITGIRISEQPSTAKAGIPSRPTDFDVRRRFIVFWTSESQTDVMVVKMSRNDAHAMLDEDTLNVRSKTTTTSHGWFHPSQSQWDFCLLSWTKPHIFKNALELSSYYYR